MPAASVVLSTYEQPRLLDLALCGYARQSVRDFEILIADDGSGPETGAVIDAHAQRLPVPIRRVWQEDKGFRKALACNRAVLESRGAHLIFSDGDCVPSRTFVEEHLDAARPGRYVVGGHIRLSEAYTGALTPDRVSAGEVERVATVRDVIGLFGMHVKSRVYIAVRKRRKPKFYGLNFSLPREAFYRVNGYDGSYAGSAKEDSDLRNRLQLAGVRPVSLWHRARVFHLHHPPHMGRIAWAEADAYYNRPDLAAEAPSGLRELEREGSGPPPV